MSRFPEITPNAYTDEQSELAAARRILAWRHARPVHAGAP